MWRALVIVMHIHLSSRPAPFCLGHAKHNVVKERVGGVGVCVYVQAQDRNDARLLIQCGIGMRHGVGLVILHLQIGRAYVCMYVCMYVCICVSSAAAATRSRVL